MTIADLRHVLDGLGMLQGGDPGAADARVLTGFAYDSRRVTPGAVFVAITGERFNGATFAPEAIGLGAAAVVSDQPAPGPQSVPWMHVRDARLALAHLSAAFYGHPSRALRVVGITGTNGKTTTSYLVRAVLERGGWPCGLVGTVHYSVGADLVEAPRTTPEALDLQALFRRMADAGAHACAMEVSSHALALRRVDATHFAAAVFTNLTQDHLDFHGDMDRYFAAKRLLFDMLPAGAPAIVNIDDPCGPALAAECPRVVSYGLSALAAVHPGPVSPSLEGLAFEAMTPAGPIAIRSRLAGRFNLYNLLAAVATGVALDVPAEAIAGGLAALRAVPGRLQIVSEPGDDVVVIVDYAHTDDALANVLEAVRPMTAGRLVTVFGCGGDRDRKKRPLMGAVAARLADVVIVTSDNPRSEHPERILDDIERGVPDAAAPRWTREADRREAITRAVLDAAPSDVVVVAGKGHERYQIIGDRVLPFDDVDVAQAALTRRRLAGGARA
jgi:UDP-N-acetylmuramoyl-L-alanyl-D-glutamate--2,6-diaminopimelate ligase